MSEEFLEKEVKTFVVYAICPDCGGKLLSTGVRNTTGTIRYDHNCPDCEYKTSFDSEYPKIKYREVKDENVRKDKETE